MVEAKRGTAERPGSEVIEAHDILEAHPDATLVVEDGVVVHANGASLRMFGVGRERVVGRRLLELLAPGDLDRLLHLEAQRAAGWDLPGTCQLRFVCDAREVTADVRFDYLARPSGRALLLSARDVTERTRAEQLVGELGSLMSGNAAMMGADALLDAGAPIFTSLGWTIAFTELHDGWSIPRRMIAAPGDPVGDYGRSIVGQRLPFEATPVLAEVVRTGRALFLDNVPSLLEGPPRTASALSEAMTRAKITRSAWCPVRVGGRMTHLLTVAAKDLTVHDFIALELLAAQVGAAIRLSALQGELLQRTRLAAIGETAAVLAHEMRNPLAVIMNTSRLLQRRVEGEGELLRMLDEEIERLNRLVRDVLVFAGPAATAPLGDVAVPDVVALAVEAVQHEPMFAVTAPRLEIDVPTSLPRVRANAALLRRVLVNLLLNALDHVPPAGLVRVAAESLPEGHVVIRVINEGAPIPDEVASRVFDPFFTTKPTGTGLGLAVVKRIVDDLGGRVVLERGVADVTFAVWLRAV